MNQNVTLLLDFLNTPLDSGDKIFERFAELPGAIAKKGSNPLERYVYVPGTRKDRVVLVAHIDTVWDKAYSKAYSGQQSVVFENGIFKSSNPGCGIGADDRAGCAVLWKLRECGHSILVVDGEEHGKCGARHLKKADPKLFKELNKHNYMIEFDWGGTNLCSYNQVGNTKKFKRYMNEILTFFDKKTTGGTDLQVLCKHICGVNLSVGYHKVHRCEEYLVLSEWENTLAKVGCLLKQPQPKFRVNPFYQYWRFFKRCINKFRHMLKSKKLFK